MRDNPGLTATDEALEIWRTKVNAALVDDPEAHGIVHIGAQDFTPTTEIIDTTRSAYVPNLPCATSGDPS